jgi:hypothetical protein
MKTFFLILFFGKTILLTPVPVDIVDEFTVDCSKKPLEAITSGAGIDIDVSELSGYMKMKEVGILEMEKRLKEKIPDGSVRAVLYGSKGQRIVLNESGFGFSNNGAWLVLRSDTKIPTTVTFDKVTITSRSKLSGVKIYWRNYQL